MPRLVLKYILWASEYMKTILGIYFILIWHSKPTYICFRTESVVRQNCLKINISLYFLCFYEKCIKLFIILIKKKSHIKGWKLSCQPFIRLACPQCCSMLMACELHWSHPWNIFRNRRIDTGKFLYISGDKF